MLDKRTSKLLSVLTKACTDGSYKIIEIGELIKDMLPRFHVSAEELGSIMRFLSNNEMIDVKYSDENVYCIAILPKGRVASEEAHVEKKGRKLNRSTMFYLIGGCFLAGLVGAFLGALLAGLI